MAFVFVRQKGGRLGELLEHKVVAEKAETEFDMIPFLIAKHEYICIDLAMVVLVEPWCIYYFNMTNAGDLEGLVLL